MGSPRPCCGRRLFGQGSSSLDATGQSSGLALNRFGPLDKAVATGEIDPSSVSVVDLVRVARERVTCCNSPTKGATASIRLLRNALDGA